MKLVHLVGFVTKKFVTMQHGHMNVKNAQTCPQIFISQYHTVSMFLQVSVHKGWSFGN